MINILVRAEDVQPGDNWTEHDGNTYVVYKNEASGSAHHTLHLIAVKNGVPRRTTLLQIKGNRLVVDRPE